MDNYCPLCCKEECSRTDVNGVYTRFDCKTHNLIVYLDATITNHPDINKRRKLENLVFEHVVRTPMCVDQYWHYYYDDDYKSKGIDEKQYINLAEIPYPINFTDKVDRVLMNIHRLYPTYSKSISTSDGIERAVFPDSAEEERNKGILPIMVDLGYLKRASAAVFCISAGGWRRLEELDRLESGYRQGFIAMRFGNETSEISTMFKKAITECGYVPMRIDEKEHNNQIVPELLYEIDRSSFLVLDVTVPNYGAYYEAGYAMGKGKEVIICCRWNEFEGEGRPHFDILQKSIVIWDTYEELLERLKKRIEATVAKSGVLHLND